MTIGFPPDAPMYDSPFEPFRNPRISPGLRKVMRSFTEALLPDEHGADAGFLDGMQAYLERFLMYLPGALQVGLPLGLRLVDLMAVLFGGSWCRMHKLPLAGRQAFLNRLRQSRFHLIRELFKGLKAIVFMAYYEHPQVMAAMGYDHPGHVREMIRQRKERYDLDVA